MSIFEDAIEALGYFRQGTIAEAANIPDTEPAASGRQDVETPAELRSALEQTLGEATQRVREAGEDHMMTDIRRFDGGVWTRTTYVFYAAGHEDYHRGQLATYARSLGLVPALTQRIHGDA
jgi:uncharacterized damage-inducible protein DinB